MSTERPEVTPEAHRGTLDPTGDPRVDAVIAGLSAIEDMDLDERPAVLSDVHDRLRELLGELGEAGRPGQPGQQGRLAPGQPGYPGPGQPGPGQPGPGPGQPRPGQPGPGR